LGAWFRRREVESTAAVVARTMHQCAVLKENIVGYRQQDAMLQ